MKKVLIIVPAYNEEENIENVIQAIRKCEIEVDFIIVNDCSTDETKNILKKNNVEYLDFPVNLGIGGAVQAGYQYAYQKGYEVAVQFDGDGQHDISYIKNIVEPIMSGEADYVVGSRYIDKNGFQSTFLRRLGIKFLSMQIKICTGNTIKDVTSGYRAVNKKYIKIFANEYAQDYPEPEALVLASHLGARIKEIPVVMHERIGGKSSIAGLNSLYYMIKVTLAIIIMRVSQERKK